MTSFNLRLPSKDAICKYSPSHKCWLSELEQGNPGGRGGAAQPQEPVALSQGGAHLFCLENKKGFPAHRALLGERGSGSEDAAPTDLARGGAGRKGECVRSPHSPQ